MSDLRRPWRHTRVAFHFSIIREPLIESLITFPMEAKEMESKLSFRVFFLRFTVFGVKFYL